MSSEEKRHSTSTSAARTRVGGEYRLGSAERWTRKSMAPSAMARQRSRFASLSDIPDATRRLSASPIGSHCGVYATISISYWLARDLGAQFCPSITLVLELRCCLIPRLGKPQLEWP